MNETIGAVVEGVDLATVSEEDLVGLQWALLEHHVLFFRDQALTTESHIAFTSRWGEVLGHPVAEALGSTDTLGRVYNDADHPPNEGDSNFHTDYTFHSAIPDLAILRALIVPDVGGDTAWASAGAGYDALSPSTKERIAGLSAHHDQGPLFHREMANRYGEEIADKIAGMFPGSEHPMVVAHPVTGRPTLFVNAGYTRHVVGLPEAQSTELLDELFKHLADPTFQCSFAWEVGSVAIWDEHATVHRGPTDFGTATRELHRYTAGRRSPIAFSDF